MDLRRGSNGRLKKTAYG